MIHMGNATPTILFFTENISFRLNNKKGIRSWIKDCITNENKISGNINFIFCDDDYLLEMNQKYLGHDTYTDIITFDLSEDEYKISGDVFISIDRARENAFKYKTKLQEEVSRLIVHGILHLSGYDDQSADEKTLMTSKEDYYLSLLPE